MVTMRTRPGRDAAIVAGIRRGRVFVDVAGTRDRAVELTASVGKQTAYMGGTLITRRGAHVHMAGMVKGVSGGELQVVLDGKRVSLLHDSHIDSDARGFEFEWRADGERHWIRLDVRDGESHLALVGNPIYLVPQPKT